MLIALAYRAPRISLYRQFRTINTTQPQTDCILSPLQSDLHFHRENILARFNEIMKFDSYFLLLFNLQFIIHTVMNLKGKNCVKYSVNKKVVGKVCNFYLILSTQSFSQFPDPHHFLFSPGHNLTFCWSHKTGSTSIGHVFATINNASFIIDNNLYYRCYT